MNAATSAPLVREGLADQIADRLSDVDELIREVERRRADKQEISRLCGVMDDIEKRFLVQERSAEEHKDLLDELHPYKKQIGDLYEESKRTVFRIQAFASSLHVPLTLCTVHFPETENHRRALSRLGLVQHYGSHVSWDKGVEVLTAARLLLGEIYERIKTKRKSAAPFHTPDGSGWEDLEIRFLSDHRVQIAIKGVSEYRNYAEMSLEDGRSHTPNKSWECLRTMAIEGSIRRPEQLKDSGWSAVEAQVRRLGVVLRQVFGIEGSPFHPYSADYGYKPRFRVSFPHPDQR